MQRSGIFLGLLAAFVFGAGGVVVKYLLDGGWSPIAAVIARVSVTAVVLAIPGLMALQGDLRRLWRARWTVLLYGTLAVAGVQLAFYSSIQTIPVATTLLIEYLAPVALVALAWIRLRRRPAAIVLAGSVVAIAGLVFVVGPGGGALDPVGLLFAAIAMIGVAAYYLLGDTPVDIPPLSLVAAGFVVGALELWIIAPTGLLPVEAVFGDIPFIWGPAPWWVIVLIVALGATALAYVSGIAAITRLGSRLASFLGLTEVLFAGIIGWILLGEALSPLQLLGGALILGGIVLIRLDKPAGEATVAVPVGDVGVAGAPVTGAIPLAGPDPDGSARSVETRRPHPRRV